MTRKFAQHASATSNVTISGGQAVVCVNGQVWRVDANDAVSVRVVSDDSGAYVVITDRQGRTRRVDHCK
jgi:membrane protein implicated in regulation of membrane protease activity